MLDLEPRDFNYDKLSEKNYKYSGLLYLTNLSLNVFKKHMFLMLKDYILKMLSYQLKMMKYSILER